MYIKQQLLHEQARTLLEAGDLAGALPLLDSADDSFRSVTADLFRTSADNHALCLLDKLWCALRLHRAERFAAALEDLERVKGALRSIHGPNMERLQRCDFLVIISPSALLHCACCKRSITFFVSFLFFVASLIRLTTPFLYFCAIMQDHGFALQPPARDLRQAPRGGGRAPHARGARGGRDRRAAEGGGAFRVPRGTRREKPRLNQMWSSVGPLGRLSPVCPALFFVRISLPFTSCASWILMPSYFKSSGLGRVSHSRPRGRPPGAPVACAPRPAPV
jgi:hypothetical protein